MSGHITVERQAAVLTVTVTNPPFNLLTSALVAELEAVLSRTERDPSVRAVVLAGGVPGVFIGHYDIDEILEKAPTGAPRLSSWQAAASLGLVAGLGRVPGLGRRLDGGATAGLAELLRFHRVIRRILTGSTVVVSAMGGSALGGGFELAAASDVRVLADGDYQIGLLESTLGLMPGGAGILLLTRSLGTSAAVEMLLEGRLFSPKAALEAGLVHDVVGPHDVLAEARRRAHRLSTRPAPVVRAIKRAVHQGSTRSFAGALARERADFLALASRPAATVALEDYASALRRQRTAGMRGVLTHEIPAWQAGTPRLQD
jgi:enoyl-CoA hydratase/carnithine racemase